MKLKFLIVSFKTILQDPVVLQVNPSLPSILFYSHSFLNMDSCPLEEIHTCQKTSTHPDLIRGCSWKNSWPTHCGRCVSSKCAASAKKQKTIINGQVATGWSTAGDAWSSSAETCVAQYNSGWQSLDLLFTTISDRGGGCWHKSCCKETNVCLFWSQTAPVRVFDWRVHTWLIKRTCLDNIPG